MNIKAYKLLTEEDRKQLDFRLHDTRENFAEEFKELHALLTEFDWYDLAGSYAEILLRDRLVALASSDEFGKLAETLNPPE